MLRTRHSESQMPETPETPPQQSLVDKATRWVMRSKLILKLLLLALAILSTCYEVRELFMKILR